jgi:hypothetical protein
MPAAGLFDVLEHVEDDTGFLNEIHRCLTPSGRLYMTVPAMPWLWSYDDVAAGHYRRYTLRELTTKLQKGGFSVLFSSYLFVPLPFPLLALRSLPSMFGRRSLPQNTYAPLHQPAKTTLLNRLLDLEGKFLSKGRPLPVGTSCLVVAEKRWSANHQLQPLPGKPSTELAS